MNKINLLCSKPLIYMIQKENSAQQSNGESANNSKKIYELSYAYYQPKLSFKGSGYVLVMPSQVELAESKASEIKKLEKYLALIKNPKLNELCNKVFDAAPIETFVLPSSTTGKNHTGDEIGKSGFMKHLQKVSEMSMHATSRYGLEDQNMKDIALTACLLHDLPYRFQKKEDGSYITNKNHAIDNSVFIEKLMKEMNFDEETQNLVCAGVGFHMGRWDNLREQNTEWMSKYEKYKEHPIVKCVQESDYYASRKNVSVDIDD